MMRGTMPLLKAAGMAAAAVAACVILFFADPHQSRWYPPCLLHAFTGMYCPGCGSTRATYHLLHGNLRQACARNALFVVLAPALMALAVGRLLEQLGLVRLPVLPGWAIRVLLAVILLFTLARNLPWPPFCFLAPV